MNDLGRVLGAAGGHNPAKWVPWTSLLGYKGTSLKRFILHTFFNLVIDNVVRNWISIMVEGKLVAHPGMRLAVGWCIRMFYADDGLVLSQDPKWLQKSLYILIGLFQQYGLVSGSSPR